MPGSRNWPAGFRVRPATATGIIDTLVKVYYVRRERDPSDCRAVWVVLTETGGARVGEIGSELTETFSPAVVVDPEHERIIREFLIALLITYRNRETFDESQRRRPGGRARGRPGEAVPKRDLNAVDGLSFTVPYGEVFGLLGPNGAGKTTTVGVLTTRVWATSGAGTAGFYVDVLRDPVAARARLAVVPQRSNLDRSLTPRQNLTFHAAYHGVGRAERGRRAARLLSEFGLGDQADIRGGLHRAGWLSA